MHKIRLTGVIEDVDGPRGPKLPRETSTTIRLSKFASSVVLVDVFHSSGVPCDLTRLTTGWDAVLSVGYDADACGRLPVLTASVTAPTSPVERSQLSFTIDEALTRRLNVGRYFFDVWLQLAGGDRSQLIRPSVFTLTMSMDRP